MASKSTASAPSPSYATSPTSLLATKTPPPSASTNWPLSPYSRPIPPLWLYVGYLDGVPVSTAELTIGGSVAGLYNISTLPAYRRRGFGRALTRQPLLDAQAHGYHTAILQAVEAGVNLYTHLGFTPFGQITEYKPT